MVNQTDYDEFMGLIKKNEIFPIFNQNGNEMRDLS